MNKLFEKAIKSISHKSIIKQFTHIQEDIKHQIEIEESNADYFFQSSFQAQMKQIKQQIILNKLIEINSQEKHQQSYFNGIQQSTIEDILNQIKDFLQKNNNIKTQALWNQISLFYFIVCQLFDKEQYQNDQLTYGVNDPSLKIAIQTIAEQLQFDKIQKQVQDLIDSIKDEQEIHYEESFDEQIFKIFSQDFKRQPFQSGLQKFKIERIKLNQQSLKEEEDFLNDLISCYEIWGNMKLIEKYRKSRVLLYRQFLDSILENESKTNLIRHYEITNFKFFDKFDVQKFYTDSDFISNLNQEDENEIYFYFLLSCLANLLKLNFLVCNQEQKLVKLIEKIKEIDHSKFKLGYKFLLKLIIDMQEKFILSESNNEYISEQLEQSFCQDEMDQKSIVWLFKEWTKQKYQVSGKQYINKSQLQLFIDSLQSVLILSILPDLVRFYNLSEPLPYQPSEIDIGYIQQIIRGKRLYLKKPEEKEKNLIYWQQLIKNISKLRDEYFEINNIKIQEDENNKAENDIYYLENLRICEINYYSMQLICMKDNLSQEERKVEEQKLTQKLQNTIKIFIQQIDCTMYKSLYRQRQFYKTLCSLFINEESIMYYIIKQIKESKIPYKTQYQSHLFKNLILSFKQEIDLRKFIQITKQRNFSLQSTDSLFEALRIDFIKAHQQFTHVINNSNKEELIESRKKFEEIISYYGFIKRKKYIVFKMNVEIYIQMLNLKIKLVSTQKYTDTKTYTFKKEISKSQFVVNLVELENKLVALKEFKEPINEKNSAQIQMSQMREISILSQLPQNDLIIKIEHYQLNGNSFQIFLEYFEGKTLFWYNENVFKNSYNNPNQNEIKKEKLEICKQIIEGFIFLHENNIVHGDIKLSNILINPSKKIMIIDFSESAFMAEETLGKTLGYDAKDIHKSKYIDYFSIGILMIKLFFNADFKYECQCDKKKCICTEINHEKLINEKINQIDENKLNQYSDYFLFQIKSLFSDQPYLRCSLKELIYIINMELQFLKNSSTIQKQKEKYIQKFGIISNYDEHTLQNKDIIWQSLFGKYEELNQTQLNHFNIQKQQEEQDQLATNLSQNSQLENQNGQNQYESQQNNSIKQDRFQQDRQNNNNCNSQIHSFQTSFSQRETNNELQQGELCKSNQKNQETQLKIRVNQSSNDLRDCQVEKDNNNSILQPENKQSSLKASNNQYVQKKLENGITIRKGSKKFENEKIKNNQSNSDFQQPNIIKNQTEQNNQDFIEEEKKNEENSEESNPKSQVTTNKSSIIQFNQGNKEQESIQVENSQQQIQQYMTIEDYFIKRIDKEESFSLMFKLLNILQIDFRKLEIDFQTFLKFRTEERFIYLKNHSNFFKIENLFSILQKLIDKKNFDIFQHFLIRDDLSSDKIFELNKFLNQVNS